MDTAPETRYSTFRMAKATSNYIFLVALVYFFSALMMQYWAERVGSKELVQNGDKVYYEAAEDQETPGFWTSNFTWIYPELPSIKPAQATSKESTLSKETKTTLIELAPGVPVIPGGSNVFTQISLRWLTYFPAIIGLCFVFFSLLSQHIPLTASILALLFYVVTLTLETLIQVESTFQAWPLKVILLLALLKAVACGIAQAMNREEDRYIRFQPN